VHGRRVDGHGHVADVVEADVLHLQVRVLEAAVSLGDDQLVHSASHGEEPGAAPRRRLGQLLEEVRARLQLTRDVRRRAQVRGVLELGVEGIKAPRGLFQRGAECLLLGLVALGRRAAGRLDDVGIEALPMAGEVLALANGRACQCLSVQRKAE